MSFGGPPPPMPLPSGPLDATLSKVASSPYALAIAIFLINIGGRFLPMEISKEQEVFLNQPWFRRIIIFVIFFLATRNIVTAAWMALIVILCVGYLFNENSSLCLFGKGGLSSSSTCKGKGLKETLSLSSEEKAILKNLQDKAAKIAQAEKDAIPVNTKVISKSTDQYQKVLRGLWIQ
jgi:hypothetical protein